MSERHTLMAQIDELQELRRAVLGRQNPVANLRQAEIDYRLGRLDAAIDTLEWCRANAALFREVRAQLKAAAEAEGGAS